MGGTPGVLKYLMEKGLIDARCMTVTGKTMAENLGGCPPLSDGQDVLMPIETPIKKTGHLQVSLRAPSERKGGGSMESKPCLPKPRRVGVASEKACRRRAGARHGRRVAGGEGTFVTRRIRSADCGGCGPLHW